MKPEAKVWAALAVVFGLFAFMAISQAVNLSRLNALVDAIPEPIAYATDDRWYSTEPPAGEPVIGLWYDGYVPRAHVVVMVYGAAYPYEPAGPALKAIEYDAPVYWRRLP